MACTEQQHTPSVERRSLGNMAILKMLPPTGKTTAKVTTYRKCAASQCRQCADGSCLGYCPAHFGDLYRAEKIDINESTGEVLMRDTQDELTSFLEYTSSTSPVKDGGDSARHQQGNSSSPMTDAREPADEQQPPKLLVARQPPASLTAVSAGPSTGADLDPQSVNVVQRQLADSDDVSRSSVRYHRDALSSWGSDSSSSFVVAY